MLINFFLCPRSFSSFKLFDNSPVTRSVVSKTYQIHAVNKSVHFYFHFAPKIKSHSLKFFNKALISNNILETFSYNFFLSEIHYLLPIKISHHFINYSILVSVFSKFNHISKSTSEDYFLCLKKRFSIKVCSYKIFSVSKPSVYLTPR